MDKNVQEVEPNKDEQPKKDDMPEGVNERLLKESKSYKAKSQEYREKYEELLREKEDQRQAKLKEEKKFEELLKEEREKAQQLEEQTFKLKQNYIAQKIRSDVRDLCPDALDVSDIESKLDLTDLDAETGELPNLSTQIDDIRKKRPYYFKKKVNPTSNRIPDFSQSKSPLKMTNEELGQSIGEQLLKRL